jgi:hypothetical protein
MRRIRLASSRSLIENSVEAIDELCKRLSAAESIPVVGESCGSVDGLG